MLESKLALPGDMPTFGGLGMLGVASCNPPVIMGPIFPSSPSKSHPHPPRVITSEDQEFLTSPRENRVSGPTVTLWALCASSLALIMFTCIVSPRATTPCQTHIDLSLLTVQ